jgi:hypothetical protein
MNCSSSSAFASLLLVDHRKTPALSMLRRRLVPSMVEVYVDCQVASTRTSEYSRLTLAPRQD